jgi:hypothetical protein
MAIHSDDHFHLLSVLPEKTCVFPRMRVLNLRTFANRYLDLFLSPTLRLCSMPAINSKLKHIVTQCTGLADLFIMSFSIDKATAEERRLLSDGIRLCTQLVNLCCPELDLAAWRHLSTLSTLHHVAVYERNTAAASTWSLEPNRVNISPFVNLKSLSLVVNGAGSIIPIITNCRFPTLLRFAASSAVMRSAEVEELLHALTQCNASQTLECIVIELSKGLPQNLAGSSLAPITPLLNFGRLHKLRIHCPDSYIYLDDGLLLQAASSWPLIHTLQIYGPYNHSTAVTFRGLHAAFRQCPHLRTLKLPVDAGRMDIPRDAEPLYSLEILDLTASSHVVDAKAVAHIIFSIFPVVHQVSGSNQMWREVNEYLESFRASGYLGIKPGVV